MIRVTDALAKVSLDDKETTTVQHIEAVLVATLRKKLDASYSGETIDLRIEPKDQKQVPSHRVMLSVKRRFETGGWGVHLDVLTDAYEEVSGYVLHLDAQGHPPLPEVKVQPVQPQTQMVKAPAATDLRKDLLALLGGAAPLPNFRLADVPDLSVIFGTYNRRELLVAAVESVRKSIGSWSYEIVVCDGGSTDGSREWLAAQPDVVLLGERRLEGAVKAFNHAFASSRGRYIANLNDDAVVEGNALEEGVRYLESHRETGQVAFAFKGDGEDWTINDIYPRKEYPAVTWPSVYSNFGITRRSVADAVAYIQGGFWNPSVYKTYAGDCELSAWIWKLGHTVDKMPHLRVQDIRTDDSLRARNVGGSGLEAKRMYSRWPADAFRPEGSDPRVSEDELARFREVLAKGGAPKVVHAEVDALIEAATTLGMPEPGEERRLRKAAPAIWALDPKEGQFPVRHKNTAPERVLHVHLGTDADPQAGLVAAMQQLGFSNSGWEGAYRQIRWLDLPHAERQARIIAAAKDLRPTLVFMQLQTANAVDVETVRAVRAAADPRCVIINWCGDIASENSAYNVDWQVPLARVCDLTLHSSMAHVRALRAAGIHSSGYLQIGFDPIQYQPDPTVTKIYDVAFLGSRYGTDEFSSSLKVHDAVLRDHVVESLREVLDEGKFGLFGRGWAKDGQEDKIAPLHEAHRAYQQAHLGLNISLVNSYDAYSSDRIFRILGSGAVLLTKRFPLMSSYGLVHGVNCLIWDTPEECIGMAGSFIACLASDKSTINGKPPSAIAEAGVELAQQHHTWDVRMQEMMAYVDAVRSVR